MANMNQMGRDLDALHTKVDAIMEALGVRVDDERQKRLDAEAKARKAYMPGGKGWKQIHGNPHGEGIEPAVPEGVPTPEDMEDPDFAAGYTAGVESIAGTPATVVMGDQTPDAEAEDEPKGKSKPAANANAKK